MIPCTVAPQAPLFIEFFKNTEVGSHSLLQGIFPTQGSNPPLLHRRGFFPTWTTAACIPNQFESLIWNISSRFPLASYLVLLNSESVFGISQGLLLCMSISQPRWILVKRPRDRLTSPTTGWRPLPFWLPRSLSVRVESERSWLWEWGICAVFNLLSEQGSACPPFCCCGASVHWGWTPAAQPGTQQSSAPVPHLISFFIFGEFLTLEVLLKKQIMALLQSLDTQFPVFYT